MLHMIHTILNVNNPKIIFKYNIMIKVQTVLFNPKDFSLYFKI